MPVIYNHTTGEARTLTQDGQWVPTKVAENPDNGERLALDGQGDTAQWKSVYKPGMIATGLRKVQNLITGDNRREFDLPELMDAIPATKIPALPGGKVEGENFAPEQDALGRAYAVGPTDKAIGDIAVKTLQAKDPNVAQKQDKFGNSIVTFRGKDYYVNRPGLSAADLPEAAGQVMAFSPASRLGLAFKGIVGAGVGLAGAGATSLAQDVVSKKMGSEQPIDPLRAGITAIAGGLERVTGPVLDSAIQKLAQRLAPSQVFDSSTGQLSERAQAALREIGADPSSITADMAQEMAHRLGQFPRQPGMAAAVSEAESLPVPVKLTQGQASGEPAQQMLENLSEKGAYGQAPRDVMAGAKAGQREAIQGNVTAIQGGLAGGSPAVALPGQGAQRVQQTLVAGREQGKEAVDAAYTAARTANAVLPPPDVRQLGGDVRAAVVADHNLQDLPRTSRLLSQLDDMAPSAQSPPYDMNKAAFGGVMPGPRPGPVEPPPVPVREMFDWLKRASSAKKAGGEEAVAINKAMRQVGGWLADAADNALATGDEASIGLFRSAIRQYREFASVYKGRDLIQQLTERSPRSGGYELVKPPDQAANVIFGSTKLFGGTNTARDLVRLRQVLPPEQWNQLREEAWMRLVRAGEGQINPTRGAPEFSGVNFAKAIDNAMTDNRATMRTLFTNDELALMQQFKRVTARATGVVKGGDNFSNTTVALSNMVQNLVGRIFTSQTSAMRMIAIPLVRSLYQAGMGLRAVAAQTPRAAAGGAPFAIGGPLAAAAAPALAQ